MLNLLRTQAPGCGLRGTYFVFQLLAGVSAWTPGPAGNCAMITVTLGNTGCHLSVVLTSASLVAKAVMHFFFPDTYWPGFLSLVTSSLSLPVCVREHGLSLFPKFSECTQFPGPDACRWALLLGATLGACTGVFPSKACRREGQRGSQTHGSISRAIREGAEGYGTAPGDLSSSSEVLPGCDWAGQDRYSPAECRRAWLAPGI